MFNVTQTSVKQTALLDGVDIGPPKWRICGHDLNRHVHEGIKDISNVKIHLKTRRQNVNITTSPIYGQNLHCFTIKRDVLCDRINITYIFGLALLNLLNSLRKSDKMLEWGQISPSMNVVLLISNPLHYKVDNSIHLESICLG